MHVIEVQRKNKLLKVVACQPNNLLALKNLIDHIKTSMLISLALRLKLVHSLMSACDNCPCVSLLCVDDVLAALQVSSLLLQYHKSPNQFQQSQLIFCVHHRFARRSGRKHSSSSKTLLSICQPWNSEKTSLATATTSNTVSRIVNHPPISEESCNSAIVLWVEHKSATKHRQAASWHQESYAQLSSVYELSFYQHVVNCTWCSSFHVADRDSDSDFASLSPRTMLQRKHAHLFVFLWY